MEETRITEIDRQADRVGRFWDRVRADVRQACAGVDMKDIPAVEAAIRNSGVNGRRIPGGGKVFVGPACAYTWTR